MLSRPKFSVGYTLAVIEYSSAIFASYDYSVLQLPIVYHLICPGANCN